MNAKQRKEIQRDIERLRKESLEHGCTADEENRIADQLEAEAEDLQSKLDEDEEEESE